MTDKPKCEHRRIQPLGGCAAFCLETGERQFNCLDCNTCVTESELGIR